MRKENNKFFDVAIVALTSMVVGVSFYEIYPLFDYLGDLIAEGVLWSLLVSSAFGWALFIVIAHYDRRILRLADTALPEELRSNQHAYNVLVECVDSEDAIDGAIKLIGRWGIGKTYFVKKIFSDFLKKKRAAYVSVAGIKSYEELEVAILSEVAPSFWREQGMLLNRFLSGMNSSFGGRSSAYFKMIVSNYGRMVVILDDVERVEGCFKTHFYETVYRLMLDTGVVVVYLCNEEEEEKASQHDLYMRSKEKFIKEIVTMKSCLNPIVRAKFDEIKSDKSLSEIVQIAEENLLSVLEKSGISSVRVWQQALEDGHRFLICARDEGIINSDSAPEWFVRVVVLRAESYSGSLDFDSMLEYRMLFDFDNNNVEEGVREANEKIRKRAVLYSGVEVFGSHLYLQKGWDNPFIALMFREHALIDVGDIFKRAALYAFDEENKPGWYSLWQWRQLYMEDLKAALGRVSSQLRRDEYRGFPDFVHIAGCLFDLNESGVLDSPVERYLCEIKDSLRRVLSAGGLGSEDQLINILSTTPETYDGYAGCGVAGKSSQQLKVFFESMVGCVETYVLSRRPEVAKEILAIMRGGALPGTYVFGKKFDDRKVAALDVFNYVDARLFVDIYENLDNRSRLGNSLTYLENRTRRRMQLDPTPFSAGALDPETGFIESVVKEVELRLSKFRYDRIGRHIFESALQEYRSKFKAEKTDDPS